MSVTAFLTWNSIKPSNAIAPTIMHNIAHVVMLMPTNKIETRPSEDPSPAFELAYELEMVSSQ